MAGLAKKLGIKSGHVVCLLNAPAEAAALIRQECPEKVSFSDTLEHGPYDVILFWPTHLAGLSDRFAQLQHHIVPDGAIWAVIPKKPFARARGMNFGWLDVQQETLGAEQVRPLGLRVLSRTLEPNGSPSQRSKIVGGEWRKRDALRSEEQKRILHK